MTWRYLYVTAKRTSHAVERRTLPTPPPNGVASKQVPGGSVASLRCVCGWPLLDELGWKLSYAPQKRLCKLCAREIAWRAAMLRRKYRTNTALRSQDPDNPWRVPAGAVSVGITFEVHDFYVHFLQMNKVALPMTVVDRSPLLACIDDPTLALGKVAEQPLSELPLFMSLIEEEK